MAKPNTKRVRLGKYTVSSHAQNRVVDPKRKMSKLDMLRKLFTKPNVITPIKTDLNEKNLMIELERKLRQA